MTTKLKPCPFCGSEARLNDIANKHRWWSVVCNVCIASTNMKTSKAAAIEAWNRRET